MKMIHLNDELGIKQIYKYYRSEDYITKDEKVLYDEFRKICYAINREISDKLLEGRYIKLPKLLGKFYIRKVKNNFKHLKFDYAHYNKTGQKTFHLNTHSNKYHAKWYWEKMSCRIAGKTIYSFLPSRENKRRLSQSMQQVGGYKKYLE